VGCGVGGCGGWCGVLGGGGGGGGGGKFCAISLCNAPSVGIFTDANMGA
jgi:hypothetical protein